MGCGGRGGVGQSGELVGSLHPRDQRGTLSVPRFPRAVLFFLCFKGIQEATSHSQRVWLPEPWADVVTPQQQDSEESAGGRDTGTRGAVLWCRFQEGKPLPRRLFQCGAVLDGKPLQCYARPRALTRPWDKACLCSQLPTLLPVSWWPSGQAEQTLQGQPKACGASLWEPQLGSQQRSPEGRPGAGRAGAPQPCGTLGRITKGRVPQLPN